MTDQWTIDRLTPEGKTMCCLCFGFFDLEELNLAANPDFEGQHEDVCIPCAKKEGTYRPEGR